MLEVAKFGYDTCCLAMLEFLLRIECCVDTFYASEEYLN